MQRADARRKRCAIYTRKSSEEGLEQEFNSLAAQRAASATWRIAAAADKGLVRLKQAAQRTSGVFAQPVTQLVRHGPRRLVRDRQFRAAEIWPRRRACRGPSGRRQQNTSTTPSASNETLFRQ